MQSQCFKRWEALGPCCVVLCKINNILIHALRHVATISLSLSPHNKLEILTLENYDYVIIETLYFLVLGT